MKNSPDTPIRVAQVMGKMLGGGVESVVMNYYRHIDRSRVQFDFLVDSDSTLVPSEEIEDLGGNIYEIPPYQHIFDYQRSLQNLFKQQKWQIVHSHINTLSVFPLRAATITGVPVRIAHSHATMGKGEAKRNLIKMILRPLSNVYSTNRVACSNYAGNWLFGKNALFSVIPNAIDLNKFLFNAEIRKAVRHAWGVNEECCVVGNLGRMENTKNQSFLIDAFAKLHAEFENSILVIAGCGSLQKTLERKVCDLGLEQSVFFLGQVDNVGDLYQGMDVFALPSLYEGFGMALLEAQVSGIPCVTSNRVSPEVVLSDNCKLLPLEDGATAWARAMRTQFINGARYELAKETLECFDIDSAAAKLCTFYSMLYKDTAR